MKLQIARLARGVTLALGAILAIPGFPQSTPAPSPSPAKDQKETRGVDQRRRAQPVKDDFFHASTRLINPSDFDWGAWIEQRRQRLLEASVSNRFFWYSTLSTALLIALMLAYGAQVLGEDRKLRVAAEILTDLWNHAQYCRAKAEEAIEKYNRHMRECNRVIEAQLSGRASPAALEARDALDQLARLRVELDNADKDRKSLERQLDQKEKLVNDLSVRLTALERQGPGSPNGPGEATAREQKLIAQVNQIQKQLDAERQKNARLKGA